MTIIRKTFLAPLTFAAVLLLTACQTPTDGLVTGGVIGGVAGNALTGGSAAGTIVGAVGGALRLLRSLAFFNASKIRLIWL